uniref:Uncharacterized protein n=1 Tax=Timema douglasi TaxID=61478 RepID=A0A7R8VXN7_TIMDO|nr:unnamed protein product [Timema douglasi]
MGRGIKENKTVNENVDAELNKSTPRKWQRTSTEKAFEICCMDFPPDSPVFKTPNLQGRKYKSDSKTERNAHILTTHTPVECDGPQLAGTKRKEDYYLAPHLDHLLSVMKSCWRPGNVPPSRFGDTEQTRAISKVT